jgi:hypothetical protein
MPQIPAVVVGVQNFEPLLPNHPNFIHSHSKPPSKKKPLAPLKQIPNIELVNNCPDAKIKKNNQTRMNCG